MCSGDKAREKGWKEKERDTHTLARVWGGVLHTLICVTKKPLNTVEIEETLSRRERERRDTHTYTPNTHAHVVVCFVCYRRLLASCLPRGLVAAPFGPSVFRSQYVPRFCISFMFLVSVCPCCPSLLYTHFVCRACSPFRHSCCISLCMFFG